MVVCFYYKPVGLTVEILNAFNIILMQGKVLNVAVHGKHKCLFDIGSGPGPGHVQTHGLLPGTDCTLRADREPFKLRTS